MSDLQQRFYATRRDFRAWYRKQKISDPKIEELAHIAALDLAAMDRGGNQSASHMQAALTNILALETAMKK